MMVKLSIWVLGVAILSVSSDFALGKDDEPLDPFQQGETENSPFLQQNGNIFRVELKSYFQQNRLKQQHPFNPSSEDIFVDARQVNIMDFSVASSWNNNWSMKIRQDIRYQKESVESDLTNSEIESNQTTLLEGVVQYKSDDSRFGMELGRSKPQWSTGISFDIANLLQPQRSQPYIDVDSITSHQGWDMISSQYIGEHWSIGGYIVKSESPYLEGDKELVVRLAYQGDNSVSILLNQIEGAGVAYAATWSRLLTDKIVFRSEWTLHDYRLSNSLNLEGSKTYQRLMTGFAVTFTSGWSLFAEYLYNEHGASPVEWRELTSETMLAAERLRMEQSNNPAQDFTVAFSGLDFISQGWLRKNYFSLLMRSQEVTDDWVWMFSLQSSLDDDSLLFRFETAKNINDNLSVRFQGELFDGCELCEYGLNPNQSTMRMVFSWLF